MEGEMDSRKGCRPNQIIRKLLSREADFLCKEVRHIEKKLTRSILENYLT
jgi:hypothetical protein